MESAKKNPKYASVLLEVAIDKPLEYAISPELQLLIKPGSVVEVPLRNKLCIGFVLEVREESRFPDALYINGIVSNIPDELFQLALWISKYYCTSLRQVFKSIFPAAIRRDVAHKEQFSVSRAAAKEKLRQECIAIREQHPSQAKVLEEILLSEKNLLLTELLEKAKVSRSPVDSLAKKGLLRIQRVRIDRSPLFGEEYFKTQPKLLNSEQAAAFEKISAILGTNQFETHLIFGITGSGKTEIYLQAIKKAMEEGIGTIMLVPEISLTAQTIERFRSRFDDSIAILHHRLSQGERHDEWHRIQQGEAKIVIGARSALFSPVKNLGLIIVDEEHEGAYKQSEESPCYQARDVAVMRGKLSGSVVVLGTATPSLESYANAKSGKYILSSLTERAASRLPAVSIIDMRREYEKAKGFTNFSEQALDGIKRRLELGEQTILFLNRRGYHTSLHCLGCGYIFKCPHCELALTFHKSEHLLSCHLCAYQLKAPIHNCPQCKNQETMKYRGVGTEQIQKSLHAIFPKIRTLRIDGDTTRHKGSHERLFREFSTGKADVLIGTQMITKGLHFPAVTLVCVLNSDSSLHIPDFRASEHVFQVITQVAGRAGRGELPGEVFIQTQMPENPAIQLAAEQNYEKFYQMEIEARKMFGFPPFTHLVKLTFIGLDSALTQQVALDMREKILRSLGQDYLVHPIAPSGYAKIKDQFRYQCLIRGKNMYAIHHALKQTLHAPKAVKVHIDPDPLSTFF